MRTLIVGIGALGGLIAARLRAAGSPVWLATRNAESAAKLKASGLRVTGVGGAVSVETVEVAPLDEYLTGSRFDLIVLATKAHDAIEVASKLSGLLEPGWHPAADPERRRAPNARGPARGMRAGRSVQSWRDHD